MRLEEKEALRRCRSPRHQTPSYHQTAPTQRITLRAVQHVCSLWWWWWSLLLCYYCQCCSIHSTITSPMSTLMMIIIIVMRTLHQAEVRCLTIIITTNQEQVKIRTRDFQAAHQVAQRLPVLSLVVTHINKNVVKRIQLGSALTKLSRGFVRLCQSKPARLTTLGPLPSPPSLRKGRGGDLLPSLPHSTPSLRSGKNEGGKHPIQFPLHL